MIGGKTEGTIHIKSGEIRALVQEPSNTITSHAGIGGGVNGTSTYQIAISGGSVTAKGSSSGAGIGSGNTGSATVDISGGSVTATGGYNGAGIGAGDHGSATVGISGGSVTATGSSDGAGIGSGSQGSAEVTISGGNVTATGGNWGAGIGSGYNSSATVTISGGSVTAKGGNFGAGIGSGLNANTTVMISGGNVAATGGTAGAGIGSGLNANTTVTISGGNVTATGGTVGAGIGSGDDGSAEVTISGGKVTAIAGSLGVALGYGTRSSTADLEITGAKTKLITQGRIEANNLTLNGMTLKAERLSVIDALTLEGKNTLGFTDASVIPVQADVVQGDGHMTLNNLGGAIKAGEEIASGTDFSGKLQRGSGFGDIQWLYESDGVRATLGSADVMLLVKGKLRGVYSLTDAINIINNDPKITAKTKASDVIIRLNRDVDIVSLSAIPLTKPCTIDGRGTLGVSGFYSITVTSPALSLVNLNFDSIWIGNPGTILSLKNVSTDSEVANSSGTINVSGRLDAEGINAAKLKLTKAKLSISSGMTLGSPISLSGASTLTCVNANPSIEINSKSLTSGSGTLTLKTGNSYVPAADDTLIVDSTNTLTSYGRLKLGTGFGGFKLAKDTGTGNTLYKLAKKTGDVTLVKGKKSVPCATFEDAIAKIGSGTGYTIYLNRDVSTEMTRIPNGNAIDGRGKYTLRLHYGLASHEALELKNLTLGGNGDLHVSKLTLSNVKADEWNFQSPDMYISGKVVAQGLTIFERLTLKKANITAAFGSESDGSSDTFTLAMSGASTLTIPEFDSPSFLGGSAGNKLALTGSGTLTLNADVLPRSDVQISLELTPLNLAQIRAKLKLGKDLVNDYVLDLNPAETAIMLSLRK